MPKICLYKEKYFQMEKRKKLRIVVLFSGGASAVKYLMENDTNYGKKYKFVFSLTDTKGASGITYLKENNIPYTVASIKQFNARHHYFGKIKDMPDSIRRAYFRYILDIISPHKADIILLSGFMLKIVGPLLGYCPIINVHPSDTRIKSEDGVTPKYTGKNAVKLAINAGETSTASTIHVVEEKIDEGRIICVSQPLMVQPEVSVTEHQNRMKIFCDGPAYREALSMICSGEFKFDA